MNGADVSTGQEIHAGDMRRHLLGLAETSYTGCFIIEGPVAGRICLHQGSVWHARRADQLHLLTWLRSVGALPQIPADARAVTETSTTTLREVAAKDPNLDLSVIEARTLQYITTEVAELLAADRGRASLIPGDRTESHFVAAWPVRELLQRAPEPDALRQPKTTLDPAIRAAATEDLFDLGMIVEN